MPELPEVEVTRRSLTACAGCRVLKMRFGKPLRRPPGIAVEELQGLQLGLMQRRGKYLWLPLRHQSSALDASAAGESERSGGGFLWHLGMSGKLVWHPGEAGQAAFAQPGPHDHADLLTDGGLLRLTDPRRFGAVVWSASLNDSPARDMLATLGPEPFDPQLATQQGVRQFQQVLAGSRVEIKNLLLSGKAVVGAGNIYASDALWEARIDPRTRACDISPRRASLLLKAVQTVLGEAIQAGGSSLRDYRDGHGQEGLYQRNARVYGREGQACQRCSGTITRIVQGQRATYFCPGCQRL